MARRRESWLAVLILAALVANSGHVASSVAAQGARVRIWITTADRTLLLAPQTDTAFAAAGGAGPLTISVADDEVFQRIVGFGASLTESSAWLLYHRMDAGTRSHWMTQLFSPADGIGLSFLRQPIGASDFSLSHYSYDDVPFGEMDDTLSRFSTAREEAYVFPAVREARRLNPQLSIMASPWSPPGWMKTSGTLIGGALRPEAYNAFASYLVKTVQAYAAQGIPVESLTLQNEPHFVPEDYPGMYIDAPEQAVLIGQYVGPAFAAAGLGTRILAWDQNWNEPEYPVSVMQDPAAARYTSGAAYHCYAGEHEVMTQFHEAFPASSVYVTECSTGAWGITPFDTALYENMRVLIRSTRNWASAVAKWNVALDDAGGPHTGGCTTCEALITVDRVTGAVTPTADFYALGHLSKFVIPGARRIGSTTFESQGVESVAFVNPDGSHVLVVWNGWGQRRVRVSWNGSAFDTDLPGDAVATFLWDGGNAGPVPVNPAPPPSTGPSTGRAVPGVIEAEDFADGAGIGFHDASTGNNGGQYRTTDVDIERTTDAGGGFNVGWISPGEWLAYPISVGASGQYRIDARVAANGPGGTFHFEIDEAATSGLTIPDTEGWQNWATVSTNVSMTTGLHRFRVVFDSAGPTGVVGNLNYVRFTAGGDANSPTAYGGIPALLPGRVEAEWFDEGPDGSAYHDAESANFGGQLRATGVDLEPSTDEGGGLNVGWMAPGEWLAYTVNVAMAGTYRFDARVASMGQGGTFHVKVDDVDVTGPLVIPDTEAWQNWTTITHMGVVLPSGLHTVRIAVDSSSSGGIVGNLNWFRFSSE